MELVSRNNIPGFENVELANSKRPPSDLKKIQAKTEVMLCYENVVSLGVNDARNFFQKKNTDSRMLAIHSK